MVAAPLRWSILVPTVVAVVGSYRKGGIVDTAVDAILAGAQERGASTRKIHLLDQHIEFCRNCRACTQESGVRRGKCVQQDDFEAILTELEAADSVVFGAPVNFFNVTALFRRFMERFVVYADWPWGVPAPKTRPGVKQQKAAVVTSAAMPGFAVPFATGAVRALKATAKVMGAKPVASLVIGLAAKQEHQPLSPKVLKKAREIGAKLV